LASLLAAFGAAAWLTPQAQAQPPAILLVERADARGQALGHLLEAQLKGKVQFRSLSYSEEQLGDPIFKGRLVASLAAAELVIPVGDASTNLALAELEETPVYFAGAAIVTGSDLANAGVGGLLSYSPADVLAAFPQAWKRKAGLLYSPGYEGVVKIIQAAAKEAGVHLTARSVAKLQDLPAAAQAVMSSSRVVWVLGDPMFSRGAGFTYLTELSLSRDVALVGADPLEVRRGAVFCSQGRDEALALQASQGIVRLLSERKPHGVSAAAAGGLIIFNRRLAARDGLTPLTSSWVEVR
jgi:ABC-type uncharacterized transport system substrate-binding protein